MANVSKRKWLLGNYEKFPHDVTSKLYQQIRNSDHIVLKSLLTHPLIFVSGLFPEQVRFTVLLRIGY